MTGPAIAAYSVALLQDYVKALRSRSDFSAAAAEAAAAEEALFGKERVPAPSTVAFRALIRVWSRAAAEARLELQQLLDLIAEEDASAGRRFRECVADEVLWLVAGVELPPLQPLEEFNECMD